MPPTVNERTPLSSKKNDDFEELEALPPDTFRHALYRFMEGKNVLGRWFENVVLIVIFLNVGCFILSTDKNIDEEFNSVFGTNWDLQHFFDWVEMVSVIFFTVEYVMRLYSVVEDPKYSGSWGRLRYMISFHALVDIAAIVPYYVDLATPQDFMPTQFIRILRLFRMFKADGQYGEAFGMFDDVFRDSSALFVTSGFVGGVVWIVIAALQYAAEKDNPEVEGRFDTLFGSMWFVLINLLGEYPVNSEWTVWGKINGTLTMIFAVGVFAIPTGILGAGFMSLLEERRKEKHREERRAEKLAAKEASGYNSIQIPDEEELCIECTRALALKGGWRSHLHIFLAGHTRGGALFESFIFFLIILNVVAFSLSTIPHFGHKYLLGLLEAGSIAVFTVEYLLRVISCVEDDRFGKAGGFWGRVQYMTSFMSLIDLVAILPFYVDLLIPGDAIVPTTFVRALRLIRMFKADAYVGAFSLFDDVFFASKDLIATCGFVFLVVWVLFSTLMYFTERHNPIEEVRVEFDSIPKSMWITLLNLSGEYPLGDYTFWGRCVSSLVAIFAIGVISLPTGILGSGFEDIIAQQQADLKKRLAKNIKCASCHRGVDQVNGLMYSLDEDVEEEEEEVLVARHNPRGNLWNFLNALTPAGAYFEMFIFTLILLNTLTFILETVRSYAKYTAAMSFFDGFETFSVLVFTGEYLARLYAAAEDPVYRDSRYPVLNQMFSFFGMVDALAILPWWIDLVLPNVDIFPTTVLRMFRLIRLLKGEKYSPVFTKLDDVFRAKKHVLQTTGFVAMVLLVVFATLLHYTERHNERMAETLTMAERYQSVPHALFYTLIHLSGDYPLYQYTPLGRVVNCFMVVAAAGIVGIPSGIIAQGFQSILGAPEEDGDDDDESEDGEEEEEEEAGGAKGGDNNEGPPEETIVERTSSKPIVMACRPCRVMAANQKGFRAQVFSFLIGDTTMGALFEVFILFLIVFNVLAFALSTDSDITNAFGGWPGVLFEWVEVVSIAVFTVEYVARLYAAAEDDWFNRSRWQYVFSFYAIVDFLAIAPFYIGLFVGANTRLSTVLRIFRVTRLLKAEHYMEAFSLFDNVIQARKHVLITTSFGAFTIWVVSAALFYFIEGSDPETEDGFDNMPVSMFYMIIILGGEWVKCDFTVLGQLVGAVLVVVGVAIFAIPAGILFSGFDEVMSARTEQRANFVEQNVHCYVCGSKVYNPLLQRLED